jgi:hypothetical protein
LRRALYNSTRNWDRTLWDSPGSDRLCRETGGRAGDAGSAVGAISFCLLEQIIGRERWMKEVARELQVPPEYVSQRFREALWEATDWYGR